MLHVPLTRRRGPGAGFMILVFSLVSAGCGALTRPWPLQSRIDASQGDFPRLLAEGAGPPLTLEAQHAPAPIHLTATTSEPLFLSDWYVEFGGVALAPNSVDESRVAWSPPNSVPLAKRGSHSETNRSSRTSPGKVAAAIVI